MVIDSRLARRGTRTYPELDYSYAKGDFRPLGLQLFRQKVQPTQTQLEAILDPRLQHRSHAVAPSDDAAPVRQVERTFYQLEQGSDDDKAAILQFRAQRRGLALPASVATYIVSRAPRDMEHLLAVLDTLDTASLTSQRTTSPSTPRAVGCGG